jgi:addiction module HigA family antidote
MQQGKRPSYSPDEVSPPGETLVDVLNAKGMSQAELAERTGRPKKTINEIVRGRSMITPETAIQFERVLGVPATFWSAREAHYRDHLAILEEAKQLEEFIAWPQQFPLSEMRRRGWISASSGVPLVRELLTFFGLASPSKFNPLYALDEHHFRKSEKHTVDVNALAVWLRQGELEAISEDCVPYERQAFVQVLEQARSLTLLGPEKFVPKLKKLCASAGVVVAFVKELPRIRTSGATRWISQDKALIQLSLRYKRGDVMWFTFFHEAAHILLHGKKDLFVEGDARETSEKEREADAFAAETLVPNKALQDFVGASEPSRSRIQGFANEIGVHPGIVVGRLQHEGVIGHGVHTDMLMRLEWEN